MKTKNSPRFMVSLFMLLLVAGCSSEPEPQLHAAEFENGQKVKSVISGDTGMIWSGGLDDDFGGNMELQKLKALAEEVKQWSLCNQAWLDQSEDDPAAVVGHINEDGETYPVATIDCDQYYAAQDSLKLAKFYAAANPDTVLKLVRTAEVYRAERDHTKACYDRAVRILTGIHALLYPPRFTDNDGRTWQFKSPLVEEQMQELSDRIRALPDEIAAIDAAKNESPNALGQATGAGVCARSPGPECYTSGTTEKE